MSYGATEIPTDPEAERWNYYPTPPLPDSSIFLWPLNAGYLARWLGKNLLMLSELVMMVILSVATWVWLYPSLKAAKTWGFGWIAQVGSSTWG